MTDGEGSEREAGEAQLGGERQLSVRWVLESEQSFRLVCRVFADAGGLLVAQRILTLDAPWAEIPLTIVFEDPHISHGELELRVSGGAARRGQRTSDGAVSLWCNIPLGPSSGYRGTLKTWSRSPPTPDGPSPDPFDPFVDDQGHVRAPWGAAIEPDAAVAGTLEFLWLETTPPEPVGKAFIGFADAGPQAPVLPFVDTTLAAILSAASQDPAQALVQMQAAGSSFIDAHWSDYLARDTLVTDLVDLPGLLAGQPQPLSLDEACDIASKAMNVSVGDFHTEQIIAPAGLYSLVWQLLYAVALAAPLASLPTASADLISACGSLGRLVRCARALRLMIDLQNGDQTICEPAGLVALQRASLVCPQAVTPPAPAGADAAQLLGVGVQKTIAQRLDGYRLGQIAEVVNIMPRERLRRFHRDERRGVRLDRAQEEERRDTIHDDNQTRSGAVLEGLRDALKQTEVIRDYTNLTADETNWPDLVIQGAWSGQDGEQGRFIDRSAAFVQAVSRGVASTIATRVDRERLSLEVHSQETSEARLIDNRQSGSAIRSVYHWLEEEHALRMRSEGRRLVVEALLPAPAAALILRVRLRFRLDPPLPPSTWSISAAPDGYASVTADNYQNAAAAYGLDLAPPPVASLTVRTRLSDQQPSGEILVPEGYAATGLTLAYVSADTTTPLMALAGAQSVTVKATTDAAIQAAGLSIVRSNPAPGVALAVGDPPSPGTPPVIPNPQAYAPALLKPGSGTGSASFSPAALGLLPVACLYGGGAFSAVAEAVCAPTGLAAATTRWQIETHSALLAAYDRLRTEHEEALHLAVVAEATEGAGRLISNELTLGSIAALAAAAPSSPPSPLASSSATDDGTPPPTAALSPPVARFLTEALDWTDATYGFYPWGAEAVRRPTPVRWSGQTLSDRNDPLWLKSFLGAGSARLLVTVRPGYEVAFSFFMAFGYPPLLTHEVFAPEAALPWLAGLHTQRPLPPEQCWRLRVPTAHAALANESEDWLRGDP